MSAICGVVGTDGRPFTAADLGGVLAILQPLGVDGGGTWAGAAGRCGVAVASVLRHRTPEDAHDRQPLASLDGHVVVAADVRLDNRAELGRALSVRDSPGVPDSAFVLAGYERWGVEVLPRLIGSFALAIVDRRRGGVLLATDRTGVRPLVVHERRGVVAFASNALALTAFDGVGHRIDETRVKEVVGLVYDSARTFVEGVRRVPSATSIWIDDRTRRRNAWWSPTADVVDLGSLDAHAEALRTALDTAVGSMLRSTGRVGAHSSGGLDSSSVAATAARLLAPERLRTYTSTPPPRSHPPVRAGRVADESDRVRDLAALHPNIEPTFLHVRGVGLFENEERAWDLGATPVRNPLNRVWADAIDQEAAADGVTTLLTGRLGNLAFSADGPEHIAALIEAGHYRRAREALTAQWRGEGWRSTARSLAMSHPAAARALELRHRADRTASWFANTALRSRLVSELRAESRVPMLLERTAHRDRQMRIFAVASAQSEQAAAVEALWGLDHRDPTVDARVLDVALAQPEWVRRHGGVTRAAARAAMADRLPPSIRTATERGRQLADWLERMTDARAEIENELHALRDHPLSRDVIDVERLTQIVRAWPDIDRAADPSVVRDAKHALGTALHVSRYLRWFEEHGRSVNIGQSGQPAR